MREATHSSLGYSASPGDRRLRLWPAVVIVLVIWVAAKVPGWIAPTSMAQFVGMFYGPMVGALAILIWWLFGSRLAWRDRLVGLAAFIVGIVLAIFLSHPTMRLGLGVFALPIVLTVWVAWLAATRSMSTPARRNGLAIVLLLAWSACALFRLDGLAGN